MTIMNTPEITPEAIAAWLEAKVQDVKQREYDGWSAIEVSATKYSCGPTEVRWRIASQNNSYDRNPEMPTFKESMDRYLRRGEKEIEADALRKQAADLLKQASDLESQTKQ
jgi:hypothetical protein